MSRFSKLALFTITLAACSNKGTPPLSNQAHATFVVDPVTAEVTDSTTDPTYRGLTNSRVFRFRACIKDVAVLQPVIGATFSIFEGNRKVDEQGTDPSGCLYWSERFQFSPTADETYLEANRSLVATTVHKGSVDLPLAVNPWRKDSDAYRDLRTQPRPAVLRSKNSPAETSEYSALLVDSLSAQLSFPQGGSRDARLDIAFEPKFKRQSFDGKTLVEAISEGTLSLRAQLEAFRGTDLEALTVPVEVGELRIHGGAARWSGTAHLLAIPARDSLLELRFEVVATNAPTSLGGARGRLEMGRLTGPVLSGSGATQPVAGPLFLETAPETAGSPTRASSFQLGKVSAERLEVLAVDGIGKPRLVEYQLLACLKNSLSLEPVLGERFRLTADGANDDLVSDTDSGCLRWKRKIEFDYASTPKPIRVSYEITGLSGYYDGARVTRAVDFIPWQIDAGSGLVDEHFDGTPAPIAGADGVLPQLLLTSASYKFIGRSFEIDPYLDLGTIRRYRFSLAPALRRMTRASGWLPPEPLATGKFHVRFLLETTDLNDPRVVDAEELDAEALAGRIQADVDFHLADLAQVMGRLRITIDFWPVNQEASTAAIPVSDTMELLHDGTLALIASPDSPAERMRLAPRLQRHSGSSSAEKFARSFGLDLISDNDAEITKAAEALAGGDDASLSKLCSLYYEPSMLGMFSSYSRCRAHPKDFLSLVRTRHVAKVESSRLLGSPETMALSMAAGYSLTSTDTYSKGTSTNDWADARVSVAGEIPGLDLVGIKIGAGISTGTTWSYAVSNTSSQANARSRSGELRRSLNVDQATFQIQGEVDRCFTIAEKGQTQSKRYFHCARASVPAELSETYYFLYDAAAVSALQDPSAPASQRPFLSLVRGSDRFQALVTTLENSNVVLVTESARAAVPIELRMGLPAGGFDGLFPGLVSDPSR